MAGYTGVILTANRSFVPPSNSTRHVPALDGLRGCAVLMVFYFHTCSNPQLFPLRWRLLAGMGWAGVDLFFVLSGYLITNILLHSRNSINYYSTFYARRALRILPVYYLGLVVILLVEPIIYRHLHHSPYPFASSFHQQIWYWLNLSNLRSAFYPLEISQLRNNFI
jgi:peptidoglycan/LPS O-acetylase OafA/YrhL